MTAAPISPAAPAAQGPAAAQTPRPRVLLLPTLVRVGGLPERAIPRPTPALTTALEEYLRRCAALEPVGEALLDPLYELIPALERPERRAVLAAKRRIFQGRPSALDDRARAAMPPELADGVDEWDAMLAQRDGAYARLEEAAAADLEASRSVLAEGLDEPGYLESLAVAAPGLVSTLAQRGARLGDDRVARSLYTLATRAALKTSPFSGLTTVSLGAGPRAQGSAAGGGPGLPTGRGYRMLAVHLAHGILMALARELDPASGIELEPLPVREAVAPIGPGAGRTGGGDAAGEATASASIPLTALPEYDYANGMVFRREQVAPATWVPAALGAPAPGVAEEGPTEGAARPAPPAPMTIREAAARLEARDAGLRLTRLLDSGAVRVHVPWQRGENPFPALLAALSPSQREAWGEDLAWLAGLGDAVGRAAGPERAELLGRAAAIAQRVFDDGELGERPSGLLYEDRESPLAWPDPSRDEAFGADCARLAHLADPWVTRSHLYELLVERFVAVFGSGGICEDPLAFLLTLAHAPDGDAEMLATAAQDFTSGPSPERAGLPGGASASPRHLGAFLQPVATGPTAWGSGGGLTVVNAFTNGNGALQARFHRLLGEDWPAPCAPPGGPSGSWRSRPPPSATPVRPSPAGCSPRCACRATPARRAPSASTSCASSTTPPPPRSSSPIATGRWVSPTWASPRSTASAATSPGWRSWPIRGPACPRWPITGSAGAGEPRARPRTSSPTSRAPSTGASSRGGSPGPSPPTSSPTCWSAT